MKGKFLKNDDREVKHWNYHKGRIHTEYGVVACGYKEVVCSYIQIATFPPTAQFLHTQFTIHTTNNPKSPHLLCQKTDARNVSFIISSRLGLVLGFLTRTLTLTLTLINVFGTKF